MGCTRPFGAVLVRWPGYTRTTYYLANFAQRPRSESVSYLAVTGFNPVTGRHLILYDDREMEELDLSREVVQWLGGLGGNAPQEVKVMCGRRGCGCGNWDENDNCSCQCHRATLTHRTLRLYHRTPPPHLRAHPPTHRPSFPRSLRGTFRPRHMSVVLEDTGRQVTPTEFERLAGKESSKKWKATIRILRETGERVGLWGHDEGDRSG